MMKKYFLICLLTVVSIAHANPQIEIELSGIHVRYDALSTKVNKWYLIMKSIVQVCLMSDDIKHLTKSNTTE